MQSAAAPDPNGTSEQLKATTSRASTVVQGPIEVDSSKPEDFDGQVDTTNEIPSPETLKKIEDYVVLDKDGKSRKFKTLYSRPNVARRVLVIFIRHFFCGVSSFLPHSVRLVGHFSNITPCAELPGLYPDPLRVDYP